MADSTWSTVGHMALCAAFCLFVGHPLLEFTGIEQAVDGLYSSVFNGAADPSVALGADSVIDPHAGHGHASVGDSDVIQMNPFEDQDYSLAA